MADENEASVEKVCKFLESRNVGADVVENFRDNKMDERAVFEASREDLQQLGLTEKGHVLCLKGFVLGSRASLVDEKKTFLATAIRNSAAERITKKIKVANRLQTKVVQIGWKHASKSNMYTQVKARSGGGVRELTFNTNDSLSMLKEEALKLFFPEGKSKKFGRLNQYSVEVGDFSGDVIDDLEMSIDSYIKSIKMSSRTRLYILTKKKSLGELFDWESEDEDEDFELPPLVHTPLFSTPDVKKDSADSKPKSALIGTSAVRNALRTEIDHAYSESLLADQEKDRIASAKAEEEERLKVLMECRRNRVLDEPNLEEAHVTITIRHPILGSKVRLFRENSVFQQVYDWIGGESVRPEHFELKNYNGITIPPGTQLYSGVFNMLEVEKPVMMSPQGTVSFQGYGMSADNIIAIVDNDVDNDDMEHIDADSSYAKLQKLREGERNKFDKEIQAEVERENVYKDLIALYQKRYISTSNLRVTFKGENAVGDGVARDVYSEFYHGFYQKMEGHFSKVPSATFDDKELQIIGKIITHAFLLYDLFPVELSKASLKHYLHCSVSDEELVHSFLTYITPVESDLIKQFSETSIGNAQAIMDILNDYSVFAQPTSANISQLIVKAANVALIRLPCFPFQALVEGMGNFWKHVSNAMINSLYKCIMPTPEELICRIKANEVNASDQKVTTWLHRYIRSCSKDELARFIRFITGAETLLPHTILKLEFCNQPPAHLHPSSKTCFKILILPRQYSSFFHLRDNLNLYMGNSGNWSVHDNSE